MERLLAVAALLIMTFLMIAIPLFLGWAVTCFGIWLITLCFGIEFSFAWATGAWLILLFAQCLLKVAD